MLVQNNLNNNPNFKSTLHVSQSIKKVISNGDIERFKDFLAKDGKNWHIELKEGLQQDITPKKLNDNALSKILSNIQKLHNYKALYFALQQIVPLFKSAKLKDAAIEQACTSRNDYIQYISTELVPYHSKRIDVIKNGIFDEISTNRVLWSKSQQINNFWMLDDSELRLDIINKIFQTSKGYEEKDYNLRTGLISKKNRQTMSDEELALITRYCIQQGGGIWNCYNDAREMDVEHIGDLISDIKDQKLANKLLGEAGKAFRDDRLWYSNSTPRYVRIKRRYDECKNAPKQEKPKAVANIINLTIKDNDGNTLSEYTDNIQFHWFYDNNLQYLFNAAKSLIK